MKLKNLVDVVKYGEIFTIVIEDADFNVVGEFTTERKVTTRMFGDWYVVFVDFEKKQVNVAPVPVDYMGS